MARSLLIPRRKLLVGASAIAAGASLLSRPAHAAVTVNVASGTHAWTSNGVSPVTITNLNSGTQFPANSVVVLVAVYSSTNGELTSGVTLNGVSMTLAGRGGGGGNTLAAECWYLAIASSQTDTAIFTDGSVNNYSHGMDCAAFYLTGSASTPTASGGNVTNAADPSLLASSINLPAGGAGIAVLASSTVPLQTAVNWSTSGNSGMTSSAGDFHTQNDGSFSALWAAHSITANATWIPSVASLTPSSNFANSSGNSPTIAAVTFAPAPAGGDANLPMLGIGG